MLRIVSAPPSLHLTVMEAFEDPNDPRGSSVLGPVPIVGPPKLNRSYMTEAA